MNQRRVLQDEYFKKAKAEGYAARSAYKLLQINERYGLLRAGDRVLDLGCAPGSWTQVASRIAGRTGFVVGIDLLPVNIGRLPNAVMTIGDAFKADAPTLLAMAPRHIITREGSGPARFDVVLSDMAPNTVGIGDDMRSVQLCRRVLELLPDVLRSDGRLVMKVLEGEIYPHLLAEATALFRFCKGYRPDATRAVSREMFIVADGFHGVRNGPALAAPTANSGWGMDPARVPPHKRAGVSDAPRPSRPARPAPAAAAAAPIAPPAAAPIVVPRLVPEAPTLKRVDATKAVTKKSPKKTTTKPVASAAKKPPAKASKAQSARRTRRTGGASPKGGRA
jgi:23S rRNA (uridine2552-2'-O)-methyltransferase